jgi:probable F420-dependent oxidoreductase
MKIGIQSAFSGATPLAPIAEFGPIIEERGFHSLWVPEHVVFFRDYASRYPYSDSGRIPGDPDGVMEPLTALTFVAAHTQRLRLGTGILLVPQRNPIYTARQVSDLDYLSGGRFDFGIGVGWLEEEFAALDVPFERRGARTREYIEVMKSLWCDEVSSFEGEFYSLPECLQNPKPVQQPHPPLIFGGESEAALRRVAEIGQGWFGFNLSPKLLAARLEALDGHLARAGRSRSDVQIHVAPPPGKVDAGALDAYREIGADQLILQLFARDPDKLRERADVLASQTLGSRP